MKSGRRHFLQVLGAATVGLIAVPFVSDLQLEDEYRLCGCGERVKALIPGERRMVCFYCATADETNAWLHTIGLRSCPHTEHSTYEESEACAKTKW
jgi:hypothetical protein